MTDEAALLAAIRDSPDDDLPRLAYADWLDENGATEGDRARAEAIRVQCELARLPDDHELYSELQARELRLFSRHGAGCREDVQALVEFRRGMLEVWKYAYPDRCGVGGAGLFARHPVREVWLTRPDDNGDPPTLWGDALADCPHAARIETLRIVGGADRFPFSDVLSVLSSPHLTGLTTLDLSGAQFGPGHGDPGLFDLLGPRGRRPAALRRRRRAVPSRAGAGLLPSLRNLRRLSLNRNQLTDHGLRLLLDSPLAETLTHLDLSHNGGERQGEPGVTAEGIRALVESPLWPRLEELNLGHLRLEDADVVAASLFGAMARSRLRVLGLSGFYPNLDSDTSALVRAMTAASSWGRLEALSLGWTNLRPRDLRRLSECPHLAGLRRLHLCLRGGGAELLAGCPHLAGLRTLCLGHSFFDDAGMEALARSPHLSRLLHLDVQMCPVGDGGIAEFVRSPNASRLRILEMNGVGDDALTAMAGSPHLKHLTIVRLGGMTGGARYAPMTDAGPLAIARSDRLPNLAALAYAWPAAAAAGMRALVECGRFAYAGWPLFQSDPELTQALRRMAGWPYPLDHDPQGLRPLFPWSTAILV
jgi:uncharacterized protein (TIGR02996 family)